MKTSLVYLTVILLFTVFVVSSCSVQKRHYQNGYYVEWNKKDYIKSPISPKQPDDNQDKVTVSVSNEIAFNDAVSPQFVMEESVLVDKVVSDVKEFDKSENKEHFQTQLLSSYKLKGLLNKKDFKQHQTKKADPLFFDILYGIDMAYGIISLLLLLLYIVAVLSAGGASATALLLWLIVIAAIVIGIYLIYDNCDSLFY